MLQVVGQALVVGVVRQLRVVLAAQDLLLLVRPGMLTAPTTAVMAGTLIPALVAEPLEAPET